MTIIEIVLLVVGALIFILSFIIPDRQSSSDKAHDRVIGMKLDRLIEERTEEIRNRVKAVSEETREEGELQTKRELERITNEKVMAIDDYSRVVLEDIEKNHKEVVFLYDMLDHKTTDLKNTIRKADDIRRDIEKGIEAAPESLGNEPVKLHSPASIQRAAAAAEQQMPQFEAQAPAAQASVPQTPAVQTPNAEAEEAKAPSVQASAVLAAEAQPVAEPSHQEPESGFARGIDRLIRKAQDAESALSKASSEPGVQASPVSETSAPAPAPAPAAPSASSAEAGLDLNSMSAMQALFNSEPPSDQDIMQNRNDRVLQLHRSGMSNVDVAKELNMGVGEVNLIIDLFEAVDGGEG